MLPIAPTEAAGLLDAVSTSDRTLAAAFGQHGILWDIQRATGGDTAEASETTVARITLYLVNTRDYIIAVSASETEVPQAEWRYIAPGLPDRLYGDPPVVMRVLDEGDVAVSVLDGTHAIVRTVYSDGRDTVGLADLPDAPG